MFTISQHFAFADAIFSWDKVLGPLRLTVQDYTTVMNATIDWATCSKKEDLDRAKDVVKCCFVSDIQAQLVQANLKDEVPEAVTQPPREAEPAEDDEAPCEEAAPATEGDDGSQSPGDIPSEADDDAALAANADSGKRRDAPSPPSGHPRNTPDAKKTAGPPAQEGEAFNLVLPPSLVQ
jgi:hypothetical protein